MRILVVCHGNICRSPMGEAILDRELTLRGLGTWSVDSAGTSSEEVGSQPDPRTLQVLREHNILFDHAARQMTGADFDNFDHILVMDHKNMTALERSGTSDEQLTRVQLVTAYDPEGSLEVIDPYHGDIDDFHTVYAQLDRSLKSFLDDLSD